MRAAIYARYSSENQRDASIEDQIEVCRRFVERQGWTLVRGYEDRSLSGASRFRPGYQELSGDLDRGLFDVVVVEALDRLGRKLADVAALHDRLGFAGIKLYAVATGEITGMHIGIPRRSSREDMARTAGPSAPGQAARRQGFWLRRGRTRSSRP
jgi:DNA invertase Pin-like site-specific DNA recombinase